MLKLKELSFSGIGRFIEPQTIDFSDLGRLVQVDGINNNTHGSSGSGKSTCFNSLDFLLGLNDLPNSVLQSRLTKDGMRVSGKFDLDGKDLTITRGKGIFSIDLNGEVTSGSNKLTEEKLDQILAMPRHLFRPMLHKRQREGGFFLQMTPKEIHSFLADCLGLSEIQLKLTKIDQKINTFEEAIISYAHKISPLDASLGIIKSTMRTVIADAPTKKIDRSAIASLREKANASITALQALMDKHVAENALLESQRPKLQKAQYDRVRYNEIKVGIEETRKAYADLMASEEYKRHTAIRSLEAYQEEAQRLARVIDKAEYTRREAQDAAFQLGSIRQCVCPTCEQSWMDDKARKAEVELLEKLRAFKDIAAGSEQARSDLRMVQKKIEETTPYTKALATDEMKAMETKESELREKLNAESEKEREFNNSIFYFNNKVLEDFTRTEKSLRERHEAEQEQTRGQASIDRTALDSAVEAIKSYEEAKERYDSVLSSLLNQEISIVDAIGDLNVDKAVAEYRLKLALESKKALKSYMSCSFDDALAEIGDMATRTIRNIPNMANATIQLDGVKETKEGKIKEEVNAIISVDGEIGVPIKSLSGGERSAVDISIDMAVIDMIEQKTGKGIDLYLLDEVFTGLDTVSIEMILEMLKNSNFNKRLVLIDHNPVIREMIEDKITVIRDGQISRIEQ